MALTFVKFNKFNENLGKKCFDFSADTLKYALTNTAPTQATDSGYLPGTLHPVPAAANGYTAGGYTAPVTGWADSAGTTTLAINSGGDPVVTATAGGIGPFRYILLYDDTTTAPVADPLIGYWDYGSSVTLVNAGDTFTFDGTASLLSLT
jgi:hypothetical protein